MYKRHVEFRFEVKDQLLVVDAAPATDRICVRVWPCGPQWSFQLLRKNWAVESQDRSVGHANLQAAIAAYLDEHGLPMGPW